VKQCYALRHVPFESLGLFKPLLVERGYQVSVIDVPVTPLDARALERAELLVVLGGPISAYEEHLYPMLLEELEIIKRRLQHGRPTIGICLGAQLIARALGAKVYPGSHKEIGWAPLQLTESGRTGPLSTIEGQCVLHWHGDTFDLPEGATLLASTERTPHQAFIWRSSAIALQFHLEVTERELEAWYVGHALELSERTESTIPELRAAGLQYAPRLEPCAKLALRGFLDGLSNPESS
jgi:GMP synthase (glutamine-hydrolysing)